MSVFGNYALYYDLLYKDKNYDAEAEYIYNLLKRQAPSANSILELGCGTGRHAALLAQRGYQINGVDLSQNMLKEAENRLTGLPDEIAEKLSFSHGDIRNVRLNKKYDVVISLFHVMSYQTTNTDLKSVLKTASEHLNDNGIFIFDCWYGPAVLTDRPAERVKNLEDGKIKVVRTAKPEMDYNNNLVDVNYNVLIQDKATRITEELKETHRMRYLFKPEIELLLDESGFTLINQEEWLTSKELNSNTWNACFIAKKVFR